MNPRIGVFILTLIISYSGFALENEQIHIRAPVWKRGHVQSVLNRIGDFISGQLLLNDINSRPHLVTVIHSTSSETLNSTGVTYAFLSSNLSNGVGAPSEVRLNFNIRAEGSHCVVGKNGDWISFPKIVNLFHELTHARQFSLGRRERNVSAEYRAIEHENLFRIELGLPERDPANPAGKFRPREGCSGPVSFEELN